MDDLKDRVRYVPRHIGHHGGHSGYDRLFEFMELPEARSPAWVKVANWIPGGLKWRLWALRPQPTQQQGLEAELGALPWVKRGAGRLCHFIYGEDTYFYTPLWKSSKNRVLATFHYPPERLVERVNPGSLSGLDAVIIVGQNQREFFQRYFADDRIFYLPHHIDTDFFRPAEQPPADDIFRMICVGHLFRDFDALLEALRILRETGVACETNIVASKDLMGEHPITREPGVKFHSGISDAELLALYQSSHAGVQPLLDATANNGLLEMLACGLPIITSAVGGVPGYVEGSAVRLVEKHGAEQIAAHVSNLVADLDAARKEGVTNREFAIANLSRDVMAQRMWQVYRAILS